jgi:hypothetical protein
MNRIALGFHGDWQLSTCCFVFKVNTVKIRIEEGAVFAALASTKDS